MELLTLKELADELDNINVRLGRKGELHGFEEAVLKQASRNFRETDNDIMSCLECEYPITIQNPTPGEHVVCPNCESEHEVKLTICLATLSKKKQKKGK